MKTIELSREDIAAHYGLLNARRFNARLTKHEMDEANAIIIPEGAKLKWSDELNKMVWE